MELSEDDSRILTQTEAYVRKTLEGEGSGHDWCHVHRVRNNALLIAKEEQEIDLFIVQLAALLHDIADWKFTGGDDSVGPKVAREWMENLDVEDDIISHVCEIIKDLSFKGAGVKTSMRTREGMVVQDADRLDALGAIGIARTFAYGGHKGKEMYNPNVPPVMHSSFEQYKNTKGHTINHFYEKLLLLKDLMNTESARRIAAERHAFMENYLDTFYAEWDGKR